MADEYKLPYSAEEVAKRLDYAGKAKEDIDNHKKDTTIHVTAEEKQSWNSKSDFSGKYADLSGKPTKLSEFENDTNYLTEHQDISGLEEKGTAASLVAGHNAAENAHSDIRLLLTEVKNSIEAFLDIDDESLNQATEFVAYMKANRELIEQITTKKVNVTDIINDYATNVANKPVSAAVAVQLKALIDKIVVPTKTSQLTNDSKFVTKDVTNQLSQEIVDLQNGNASVPDYWKPAIKTAVAKVKTIQDIGGNDVISFIHVTDIHRKAGGTNYTDNVGVVCNDLMEKLDILNLVDTGDRAEQSISTTSSALDDDIEDCREMMSPVDESKQLYCKSNHDGAWGDKATYGATYAMIQHPKHQWNTLFRWQAKDSRRVFSKDGSYYYLDHAPQKVRFIVLNSHWADYSNITESDYNAGSTEYNTQKNINYGDEQAEWLATEALDFGEEDGWTVCVFTHAPLWNKCNGVAKSYMNVQYAGKNNAVVIREILVAFYNKTSVAYKTGSNIDFSNVGENNTIAGVWCGHCHTDLICKQDENTPSGYTSVLPFPVISATSASNTNSSYEEGFGVPVTIRTLGTATETALTIVNIIKATGQIFLIRVGAGEDRTTFYGEGTDATVELLSISATYSGGNVEVGTSINSLTGIKVTAHYSDGSTQSVTDYTMSGSVANVGNNTITITYSGMTTTITVVGIEAEPSFPSVVTGVNVFDKTADGFLDNQRISSSATTTGYITSATDRFITNYIRIDNGMYATIDVPGDKTTVSIVVPYYLCYDENKNVLGIPITPTGSVSNHKLKFKVEKDKVAYIRICPYKNDQSGITVDNCNVVVTTS